MLIKKNTSLAVVIAASLLIVSCEKNATKESVSKMEPVKEEYKGLPEFKESYTSVRRAICEASPYDIEQTIKVMNAMEMAQQNVDSLGELLEMFSRMNLHNVAHDVLESKLTMFDLLQEMRKLEIENREFKCTDSFMMGIKIAHKTTQKATMGGLEGKGIYGVVAFVGKEALLNGFDEIERNYGSLQDFNSKYKKRMEDLRERFLLFIASYTPLYEKYCKEWDSLCLLKDRAYLDIYNERFDNACATTSKILEKYPDNRETMLLNALSHVMIGMNAMKGDAAKRAPLTSLEFMPEELSEATADNSEESFAIAQKVLDKYIDEFPNYSAPALVLQGIIAICGGKDKEGLTLLDHASVEYPRQASHLLDMMELYKSRVYLNKTLEGKYLLRLYRSTMEGYGIFSPNLIKAGYYAMHGDSDSSKREIFNHFFRRGNQEVYHCLLSDMQFCDKFLDCSFRQMVPEHFFMDIGVSNSLISKKKLNISLNNRSNVALQNVRVFLCLHLTDMYTDEYEILKVPTKNQVPAMQKTDFEPIAFNVEGKTTDDIAHVRAIVMTDDAICWIDDVQYKQEKVVNSCKKVVAAKQSYEQIDRHLLFAGFTVDKLQTLLSSNVVPLIYLNEKQQSGGFMKDITNKLSSTTMLLSPESKWLKSKGKLRLELPRSLVLLDPVFSLKQSNGQTIQPSVNIVADSKIKLMFDVEPADNAQFTLYIYNRYVGCKLLLSRKGDEMVVEKVTLR